MKNYLMIDGEKLEFADDVIEKIKKMFTKDIPKDSPEDKCEELSKMVAKAHRGHAAHAAHMILYKDKCFKEIIVNFPEANTDWSIGIMSGIIEFCKKYPSTMIKFDCRKIMYLTNF